LVALLSVVVVATVGAAKAGIAAPRASRPANRLIPSVRVRRCFMAV
jgi:hypothetical protein